MLSITAASDGHEDAQEEEVDSRWSRYKVAMELSKQTNKQLNKLVNLQDSAKIGVE